MEGHHDAVQERQAGTALKERGDVGTHSERIVPDAPCLQGGARYFEFLGGLTLGDAPSAQLSVLFKEVCTFEAIPAWLTTLVDVRHVLDDGSHSDLLCQALAL
jgi:hypothetical protein